jgi:hypothetical protein
MRLEEPHARLSLLLLFRLLVQSLINRGAGEPVDDRGELSAEELGSFVLIPRKARAWFPSSLGPNGLVPETGTVGTKGIIARGT